MSKLESLRIKKVESLVRYVRDLDRSRAFFTDKLDFAETGVSGAELNASGKQKSAVVEAGDVRFVLATPAGEGGRASRWLRKHPDGIGTIVFEVEDVDNAFKLLESRRATPITGVQTFTDDGGTLKMFSITTPLGDTTMRFVERRGYSKLFPGFEPYATPKGGTNSLQFGHVDHITTNFQTMEPALLWMEHVLGFDRYWDIQFHSTDPERNNPGSGLKSIVMWDPVSTIKFANNEPLAPYFKASQINLFGDDHRGDGVQHAALTISNIIGAVKALRAKGVPFTPTPGSYYDDLPARLKTTTVGHIDESLDVLRDLHILMDGSAPHSYLLQIFLQEASSVYNDKEAGPFFIELIERKGDKGFGGGNFRALFDSIERQQRAEGRIA